MRELRGLGARVKDGLKGPDARLTYIFALEGMLFQFSGSIKAFGNNLFATNLGASDTQIGLIQTIGCAVTVALLLPVGIIADRCRSPKTVPVCLLFLGGLMFILESLVPAMGAARMALFFLFMGLAGGLFGAYGGQWQSMFGDLVDLRRRNQIYALRNRVMAALGMVAPMLLGIPVSRCATPEAKLRVLSVFFFISGLLMLAQGVVVLRALPGGRRTAPGAAERFSLQNLGQALLASARNRPFVGFVFSSLLLYMAWHFDWGMWYIGQTQYALLSEAQLSYYNAFCCIAQIFALGFWARVNQKVNVYFTSCFCAAGIVLYPFYMILISVLPAAARPWTLICLAPIASSFECAIGMVMVQMLLAVVPEKHRSLTVSLYTILTTLSNALLPLLGVRLYTALGADARAFRLFFAIEVVVRGGVAVCYALRYRRMRATGELERLTRAA